MFIDGVRIVDDNQSISLRRDRAVDLELRWRDPEKLKTLDDHSITFEWARNSDDFNVVDESHLRTGTTVTAIDILGSNDLLVPLLDREIFPGQTQGWQGTTQWGDIDNDGDMDVVYTEMNRWERGTSFWCLMKIGRASCRERV